MFDVYIGISKFYLMGFCSAYSSILLTTYECVLLKTFDLEK
jgi:hypothetical protein